MTDPWQPLRDYAQAALAKYDGRFDARPDYIADVVKYAAATVVQTAPEDMIMAERIARHTWDSTPYKVIPHLHLKLADIPAGAVSPKGIMSDADLTVDMVQRLKA